jgi:hypothetical protein
MYELRHIVSSSPAVKRIEDNMRTQDKKIPAVQSDAAYCSAMGTGNSEPVSSSINHDSASPSLHLFEYVPRITFAERYPVLMCLGIAFTLLASAVLAEVECLQRSGYFWR